MKNKKNFTIWFTGLSSSGKTTLAKMLYENFLEKGRNDFVFLDGDEFRKEIINSDYSDQGREMIGLKKAEFAKSENINGRHVIVTGIVAQKKWRVEYRKIIPNYFEIYTKCSLVACMKRDKKNVYNKSDKDDKFKLNIVDEYEDTSEVDLILDTEFRNINDCFEELKIKIENLIK